VGCNYKKALRSVGYSIGLFAFTNNWIGMMGKPEIPKEYIDQMLLDGSKVRNYVLEYVNTHGDTPISSLVFGMVELIIDLKPEDDSMEYWVDQVGTVIGHFAREKLKRLEK